MSKQIDINPFSITVGVISLLSATVLSCGITDIITHNSLKKKFRNDVLEEQVRLLNSNSSTINKGVSSLNNDNCEKPSGVYHPISHQNDPALVNANLVEPTVKQPIDPTKELLDNIKNLAINPSSENFDDESEQLLELYHKYARPEHIPSQKVPKTIKICHMYVKVFWRWETVDLDSILNRPNSYFTEGNIGYVQFGDTRFDISKPDSLKSVYRKLNMYRRLIIENSIKNTVKK